MPEVPGVPEVPKVRWSAKGAGRAPSVYGTMAIGGLPERRLLAGWIDHRHQAVVAAGGIWSIGTLNLIGTAFDVIELFRRHDRLRFEDLAAVAVERRKRDERDRCLPSSRVPDPRSLIRRGPFDMIDDDERTGRL